MNKSKKIGGVPLIIVIIIVIAVVYFYGEKDKKERTAQRAIYMEAKELQESKRYKEALAKYKTLKAPYKDSEENKAKCEEFIKLHKQIDSINTTFSGNNITNTEYFENLKEMNPDIEKQFQKEMEKLKQKAKRVGE